MTAYIYHLRAEENVRTVDHLMYKRTFKGAIDGVARYGYYHLVRWITRRLSSGTTAPNLYTVLSVICVWGASPLIAWGMRGGFSFGLVRRYPRIRSTESWPACVFI